MSHLLLIFVTIKMSEKYQHIKDSIKSYLSTLPEGLQISQHTKSTQNGSFLIIQFDQSSTTDSQSHQVTGQPGTAIVKQEPQPYYPSSVKTDDQSSHQEPNQCLNSSRERLNALRLWNFISPKRFSPKSSPWWKCKQNKRKFIGKQTHYQQTESQTTSSSRGANKKFKKGHQKTFKGVDKSKSRHLQTPPTFQGETDKYRSKQLNIPVIQPMRIDSDNVCIYKVSCGTHPDNFFALEFGR